MIASALSLSASEILYVSFQSRVFATASFSPICKLHWHSGPDIRGPPSGAGSLSWFRPFAPSGEPLQL